MYHQSWWVLVLGIVLLVAALPVAGRRVWFLYRLITSGKPAPDRLENVTHHVGETLKNQAVEVFGQKKLLKWSVPGAAHFMVFWAFVILGTVYLEAFGVLFSRNAAWHIWLVGRWDLLGFAQDLIAVLCLVGIVMFAVIRVQNAPERLGRKSRFSGSHLGGAWLVLFMIFNVLWTLFLFRAAGAAEGSLPYGNGAFASHLIGHLFGGLSEGALKALVGVGLLLHIGVMLAFLVIVLNSKHLHIFVAPLNVAFGRHPVALGAVKPLTGDDGKPVSLDDVEDMDEDTVLGVGSIGDFSWKGILDFSSCTECGRCQSQCPAWNTEKPLSPKLLIMNLRDHALEAAPALIGASADGYSDALKAELERPLVGATEGDPSHPTGGAVIDDDVLWSCVTCGACVEQCPVDIEHVDHIVDMRRYQVLVESNFPAELNQLFKGMENKGNPWNMSPTARLDWTQGLDFDVKVVGEDVESLDEVEWLFWVGCAGAYEDRAKKTTRAVAELLNIAEVDFAVLGNGETCTGDQARRAGNEFVFQGLATQNAETFKEHRVKKVVSTCAHCFNTLKNEYSAFGVELEVVHHTQLLNRLVREGRLTPVADGAGAHKRSITYHDPCYIGRHNGVYSPPRELLEVLPGADFVEMERNSERSFCCGAGGARMWMEENIGTRINMNRTTEAVGTGADQIAVGCPFCRVMLSDGLTAAQDAGDAREEVEVLDVAQMLLASVKGEQATRMLPGAGAAGQDSASAGRGIADEGVAEEPHSTPMRDREEAAEPKPPAPHASGGSSLFDDAADDAAEADADTASPGRSAPEEAKAAQPASAGGSLFDVGDESDGPKDEADAHTDNKADDSTDDEPPADEPAPEPTSSGGSLFDVESDAPASPATAEAEPKRAEPKEPTEDVEPESTAPAEPAADLGSGGSLFDISATEPTPAAKAAPEPEAESSNEAEPDEETQPEPERKSEPPAPATGDGSSGSMFDVASSTPGSDPQSDDQSDNQSDDQSGDRSADDRPTAAEPPTSTQASGGSLFDIAAPAAAATTEPAPALEPEAESKAEVDPEAAAEPEPAQSAGAALSAAATFSASDDDPEPADSHEEPPEAEALDSGTAEAESEPTDEPEADDPEADEPADEPVTENPEPKRSGATHTPKTDADISGSSSLFDL